jgi:amidophosphoribosyltransferase
MCGIVGITGSRDAAELVSIGLFALQHRGQESAGIVSAHDGRLELKIGMGTVDDVFAGSALKALRGDMAVGHVRYATSGASHIKNAQPLVFNCAHGQLAIAHNGNLTNALALRNKLEQRGAIFQSSTDTEVIIHLIARHKGPVEDAVLESLKQVEGSYSLLFLTKDKMIAARDPLGFRPLVLGKLGRGFIVASETTALNLLGAKYLRDIEAGEIVILEDGHIKSLKPFPPRSNLAQCVFEQVYFSRPDSVVFGKGVQATRSAMGRELAREMKGIKADIVVPVPDSGVPSALGFSQESGIPLEMGFVRSHYIGRTFIQPAQGLRDNSVSLKLLPIEDSLRGKRVILIDDSIVRGTTSRKICRMLRRSGVKEIHMAISSPPIISPCYYGIDTPSRKELIAANHTQQEVRKFLGVDSLHHLSLAGLLKAVGGSAQSHCAACFTGHYPTPIADFSST